MNAVTTSWQCFSWYFLWMIAMLSGWDEDKSSTTSIPLARRLSWSWLKENCPLLGSHRKLLFSLGNNADCWCFCEITSLVFEILSVASKNRDRVQSVMVRRVLRIAKFKNALYLWIKLIIRFDDDNVDILNSLYLSHIITWIDDMARQGNARVGCMWIIRILCIIYFYLSFVFPILSVLLMLLLISSLVCNILLLRERVSKHTVNFLYEMWP